MSNARTTALDLDGLVEHMFEHVLNPPERAELLAWIRRWEQANPDADAAHRVTGWIDVAYAFQVREALPAARRSLVSQSCTDRRPGPTCDRRRDSMAAGEPAPT